MVFLLHQHLQKCRFLHRLDISSLQLAQIILCLTLLVAVETEAQALELALMDKEQVAAVEQDKLELFLQAHLII
jgi:hypothetical protein